LIFGWQANPQASLEELCQSAGAYGVKISPQGLQERLNSVAATEFLRQLLMKGTTYLVQSQCKRNDLLASFAGIYIQDSSKIRLPNSLHTIWQGNKNDEAALKIQAVLDYQLGSLELSLASGQVHDSPLQSTELPLGCLRLADLGYFNTQVFKKLTQDGVWWVSRVPSRAGVWKNGSITHLAHWLQAYSDSTIDQTIELTAQRLKCRLIALPVPAEVAQERRQRVIEAASNRKNSKLKPETLILCDWTILITNLPADKFSTEDIVCLQRLRWQIELLFKLWKSALSVDEWRSENPYQILSEIYAKLLMALIQHWLLLLGCWDYEERSLVKASQLLRKHAFQILMAIKHFKLLKQTLALILPTLARCKVQKRKARPATFQIFGRASP
jgi:hypothetical protein